MQTYQEYLEDQERFADRYSPFGYREKSKGWLMQSLFGASLMHAASYTPNTIISSRPYKKSPLTPLQLKKRAKAKAAKKARRRSR